MRRKPGTRCGYRGLIPRGIVAAGLSLIVWIACVGTAAQAASGSVAAEGVAPTFEWQGLAVGKIAFEGVPRERLEPLPAQLAQQPGKPLSVEGLRESLRQLFATGLYETIRVEGERTAAGVDLSFRGTPRIFVGTVGVYGAKGGTLNVQLQRASQLTPGTRFTDGRLSSALDQMRGTMSTSGFYKAQISASRTPNRTEQLIDLSFRVIPGVQARVGNVEVTGDAGMTAQEFRRHAHLRAGSHVDRDTRNRALNAVLKYYQGQERMEAEIKIVSEQYDPITNRVNFSFLANRGPVVHVRLEGAGIATERLHRLVPIFEEGTVDEDLLNEGNRNLRDYFQQLGYFDVKVSHQQRSEANGAVTIVFKVEPGAHRRVQKVDVAGNRYFDAETLKGLLSVHATDSLDRHGAYSQALVAADVDAIRGVYRNNGFADVKVTPQTSTPEDQELGATASRARHKTAPLTVTYKIEEGAQTRVGKVELDGNEHVNAAALTPLLNTGQGQLLSPQNLSGDRDTILTEYMNRGFEQVGVDVEQQPESSDPHLVDVIFHITEGPQIFVRNVLVTGVHYTRQETVDRAITVHAGDPLNQAAMLDTQRNLYDLALFNEVNVAVENPTGGEARKTVLLQTAEARRWALTYGFGFEAQTGTPENNCAGALAGGVACNPNGKTGVSPRVLADLTRNNVFGREQSASLQATYGLLEQRIALLFQIPHFQGNRNLGVTFTGGYANSQDVTTYVASRLEGGFRFTRSFQGAGVFQSKANTFVLEYDFRRVKVAASSLQVYPGEIEELATAVRVAGPGMTWIRDTRDSTLDAHHGTYTSFQEFLSNRHAGAEAEFNRLDVSNSSYYGFGKDRFVFARNTRYGQIRSFGPGTSSLIPLPERLFAGGPTSLRGFSFNAAGPRDPETGYPIGGAGALINSSELRLPPPTLPWLGETVSFVLFHDMGNVFTNAGDAWAAIGRVSQPDRDTCKVLTSADTSTNPPTPPTPTGPVTSTGRQGNCNFAYFSHAPGIGLRYHTPVGPLRFDFSYNLNTPIYPVNIDYSLGSSTKNPYGPYSNPHVGQAPHFNFFFSLGQTF